MHRLRTRKKAKAEEDIPPVPSIPPGKGFKKGKKEPQPEKPQIDLDSALPPSDDFRTSLLLPNLANRFSILKAEQVAAAMASLSAENEGRVADDSRISYQPAKFMALGDIAETNSIAGSSFSGADRQTFHSDDSRPSDDYGVLNRPRGGDGNVLFGGRQKVYRVPASRSLGRGTSSMEDLRSGSPLGIRAVYNNDVPEPRRRNRAEPEDIANDEVTTPASENSDYNKNRYTSSSTNSTNPGSLTRSSTAATSIHSQGGTSTVGPNSSSTSSIPLSPNSSMVSMKPRKPLYEQALDQQLQDQQNTAMGRLERLASMRRVRAASPPPGNYPMAPLTAPVSPISRQPQPWPSRSITPSSPLSSPAENGETEEDEMDDRRSRVIGKAFPALEFGMEPRSQTPLSPPVSAAAAEFPTKGLFTPGQLHRDRMRPMSPDLEPEPEITRTLSERKSSISLNAVGDHEDKLSSGVDHDESDGPRDRTTFFSSSSLSDDDMDDNDLVIKEIDRELDAAKDFVDDMDSAAYEHANARKSSEIAISQIPRPMSAESMASETSKFADSEILKKFSPTSPQFSVEVQSAASDSPTLPPQGLSVLVHKHLRSDSTGSSMYAGSTYTRYSRMSRVGMAPSKASSIYGLGKPGALPSGASGSSNGNMWEFEDFDGEGRPSTPPSPRSFLSSASTEGRSPEMPVKSSERDERTNIGERKQDMDWERVRDRTLEPNSPESAAIDADDDDQDNWEQQLAYRRQLIQQNIRNQEKINSQHELQAPNFPKEPSARSGSPSGFSVLRSKTSNGFLKGGSGKAAGVLGVEPNGPTLGARPEHKMRGRQGWNPEEERKLRDTVRGPHNVPPRPNLGPHPSASIPAQRPPRPQVNTSHLRPEGGSANNTPGLPHPKKSPMYKPRQTPSREQLGPDRMPRGQPMGWNDPWNAQDSASSSRRPSPAPSKSPARHQPITPKMDSYDDDLSRAMRTGQSKAAEETVTALQERERERNSPERYENEMIQSSFEVDAPPKRSRANSINARQAGKSSEEEPLSPRAGPPTTRPPPIPLPISTQLSSLQKSPSTPELSPSASSVKSAAAVMQTIQATNAQFAPAKKRSVSKAQIGEPRLLSSTSSVPTVSLPSKSASVSSSPVVPAPRPRRRTNTNTIFAAFSKNRSSDEVPPIPAARGDSVYSDDETEAKPKKSFSSSKLRKSTSDGGALASRARAHDVDAEAPSMPTLRSKAAEMI